MQQRHQIAAAGAEALPKPLAAAKRRWRAPLTLALLFLPTILATIYYGLVAVPRFQSEAQFLVRATDRPAVSSGIGALLQVAGLGRSTQDVYSVQSFIASRDAIRLLSERVDLKAAYENKKADWLAKYPSLFYGSSAEEFHRYFNTMVKTFYSTTSGITTLRVQAFEPETAKKIAEELLSLGEVMVNRMNDRMLGDSVRSASDEVKRAEQRLIDAQVALTSFRNSELMIDPAQSSLVVSEVIGRLTAEQVQAQAQLSETQQAAPNSPMVAGLRLRIGALDDQIKQERKRISNVDDGLAKKLADYERLVLNREFAKEALASAGRAFESNQIEARRQQLYLERIVEPNAADHATRPARLQIVATVFGFNVVLLMIGWLVFSGMREHVAAGLRNS